MNSRCHVFLSALAMTLACQLCPAFLRAQGAPKKMIVLAGNGEQAEMSRLAELLTAHLSDLTRVSLETVAVTPRALFFDVATADTLVKSHGAFSAVWVDRSIDEVHLFVSDGVTHRFLRQTFEESADGWAVECEAVAALVRSALMTWLFTETETNTPPPSVSPWGPMPSTTGRAGVYRKTDGTQPAGERNTASERERAAADAEDRPESSVAEDEDGAEDEEREDPEIEDDAAEDDTEGEDEDDADGEIDAEKPSSRPPRHRKRSVSPALAAHAGYLSRMVGGVGGVTHNGDFAVGVRLLHGLNLRVGVQVGTPLALDVEGDAVGDWVFRHVPLYLNAGWLFRIRMIELGLSAAFVLDFTYIDDRDSSRRPDEARRNNPGLGLFGRLGVRPSPLWSIFATLGCDLFFKTYEYTFGGGTLLTYGPVQPFVSLGVEVTIGDWGKRNE